MELVSCMRDIVHHLNIVFALEWLVTAEHGICDHAIKDDSFSMKSRCAAPLFPITLRPKCLLDSCMAFSRALQELQI